MSATETIRAITSYTGTPSYMREGGFKVITDQQEIILAIEDESSCCESWGYFLTEDDTEKFVGARLLGVRLTDTNRSSKQFVKGSDYGTPYDEEKNEYLDEGDVMFVDIETDRGILQFVAYNGHNGYYGHTARVSSKQVTHEATL